MRTFDRSSLLQYSAQELYSVVSDIESYPRFLPGCVSARIEEAAQEADGRERVRASLGFRAGGLSDTFRTENLGLAPQSIEMRLLQGPFKFLAGTWTFKALAEDACKVSLHLELEFGSRLLDLTLGPWLDQAAGRLMDAFIAQAAQRYGRR